MVIRYFFLFCVFLIGACGIKGPPLPPVDQQTQIQEEKAAAAAKSEVPAAEAITTKKKKIKK